MSCAWLAAGATADATVTQATPVIRHRRMRRVSRGRDGLWEDRRVGSAHGAMRVILADDGVVIREGLARLLTEAGIEVIAQVGDADALHEAVRTDPPDVALVDIRMPRRSPTTDCAPRSRSAPGSPAWRCCCSPSTSTSSTP